ncbi:COX15/CtaA family protein [Massilia sp. W12]|uniref:COX15/CtaA family protein n=1 Tax=Massilia sp. W12 TaxID=3126507 RepID=UPI0030CFE0E2
MEWHKFLQLAITGLLVASFPLSIVWARKQEARYVKLCGLLLFLTFDLIVFGAYTRLSDSGLGCPDWPGCYGHANPLQAHAQISAAEAAMPHGPVTVFKAWVEMIHRFLAMGIGILITTMCVLAWQRRKTQPVGAMAYWLFALVCVQGAFGAWTVTMKLQPLIVTIHLLLGMLLLAMIAWHWARLHPMPPAPQAGGLRMWARLALVIVFCQIALGGWVSTNYATLACMEFPMCQGRWLPEMDWGHGFTLWRELGKTGGGDWLPFAALTAIHWLHRNFAWLVLAVCGVLAWRARGAHPRAARMIGALLLAQFCTGLLTIYFKFPLLLALLHNAGAAALVLCLSMLNSRLDRCPDRP